MALGCCHEHNCRRTTPIHLVMGDLSGRVFVVTRSTVVKDHGNGRATFRAEERHDITEQFTAFIRDNPQVILDNPEIVEAVTCE